MKRLMTFLYVMAVLGSPVLAVNMTGDDGLGTSSFNAAGKWADALAPSAGKTYSTVGYLLRTPSTAGNYTFAGDSLTVGIGTATPVDTNHNFRTDGTINNNSLISKTPGTTTVITINNLILDAGYIRDGQGSSDVWTLTGNINVTSNGGGLANQCRLNLDSVISGSGTLYVADNGSGEESRQTYIRSALNTYNGSIYLLGSTAARCRLTFVDDSRMNFVIGASGVNNTITVGSGKLGTIVFNGDFNFDLTGAGTAIGDSWTIASVTTQTFGDTFTVVGFTAEADGVTWTKAIGDGSRRYEFSESTGILAVKVQPPHNPNPADKAKDVPVTTTTLQWKGAELTNGSVNPNIVKYYVYTNEDKLSETEPNLTYQGEIPAGTVPDASYALGITLPYNKTIYWKIEQVMSYGSGGQGDPNNVTGPVWSFTTVPLYASISAVSPAYKAVDAGVDVVLSVTGTALETYQWYRIASPDDVLLTNGDDYSGVDTATLTIHNVQLVDEGYYYCKGSNAAPSSASNRDTGPGRVMTKRLTSHYPFEVINNNVTPDIVGGFDATLKQESASAGWPALSNTDAVAPSLGSYLQFTNADHAADPNGQYAQIGAGVVDYEDITISAWVYPKGGTVWNRVFDFGNGTTDYLFLTPDNGSGNLRFAIKAENGAEQQLSGTWLPFNSWYHIAITIGGDTGRMYRNGELIATNTGMTINPINVGAVLNYLGKSQFTADAEFNGNIDDLKIYNYARTTEQIAQDYLEVAGGWVCNKELTALPYDFDNNCQVDLGDFAKFAATWLESNRINAQ
jgi:hypothetical protein